MTKTMFKTGIGVIALLALSACTNLNHPTRVAAHGSKQCRLPDTLTCEKFADETYNCTCQKGDRLRDVLDANRGPDY